MMTGRKVRGFLVSMNINDEEVIQQFLRTQLMTNGSELRDTTSKVIESEIAASKRRPMELLDLCFAMEAKDISLLQNAYPEIKLGMVKYPMGHPHAFAANAQACEGQRALQSLGF